MHETCPFIHFSDTWSHGAFQRSVDSNNSRVSIIKLCKRCVNTHAADKEQFHPQEERSELLSSRELTESSSFIPKTTFFPQLPVSIEDRL
jgi:hypothetical protein